MLSLAMAMNTKVSGPCAHHEGILERRDIAPCILNTSIKKRDLPALHNGPLL